MTTYGTSPTVPRYRDDRDHALAAGDWDHAYSLACREETVRYVAAPIEPKTKAVARAPRRRRGRAAAASSDA